VRDEHPAVGWGAAGIDYEVRGEVIIGGVLIIRILGLVKEHP
jgi:hypothetical protein